MGVSVQCTFESLNKNSSFRNQGYSRAIPVHCSKQKAMEVADRTMRNYI